MGSDWCARIFHPQPSGYTNIMVSWTLAEACQLLDGLTLADHEALAGRLGLNADEPALWDRVSRCLRLCWHDAPEGPVISQFEGYERLRPPDAIDLPPDPADRRLDWALDAAGDTTNAYQIGKQADLLAAFHLLGGEAGPTFARLGVDLTPDLLHRTIEHYLARSVHGSSLARIVYAGALAGCDRVRAWELFGQAFGTDLDALTGESAAEGVHLGAMAGTLDLLQRHFFGLSTRGAELRVAPNMPPGAPRMRLALRVRGAALDLTHDGNRDGRVRLQHRTGPSLRVRVGDRTRPLSSGDRVVAE